MRSSGRTPQQVVEGARGEVGEWSCAHREVRRPRVQSPRCRLIMVRARSKYGSTAVVDDPCASVCGPPTRAESGVLEKAACGCVTFRVIIRADPSRPQVVPGTSEVRQTWPM